MKVLVVLRHVAYFRFFDGVIRDLCASGHSVEVLLEHKHQENAEGARSKDSPRALLACQAELDRFGWGWALHRSDFLRKPIMAVRELINYTSYLKPGRQTSRMVVNRSANYVPGILQRLMRNRAIKAWLMTPIGQQTLRWFERLVPPDRSIVRWLRDHRPDVVVASPVIMKHSEEIEYIKAVAALRIPTMVAVTSWDHLTTKGVFQLIPNMTLVWNQVQVEEAVRLHGIPRDQVVFTGAPVFDAWFRMQPTMDRAAFCRQVNLDPERPFVLYLCSSRSIAKDETEYVEEVARGLRQHPGTGRLNMLVRPYPWHAEIWRTYAGDLLTIWPHGGNNPDTREARQDYYHALHFSAGVIGINTSGFIDAAVVDRPCVTILGERYRDTQRDMSHFHHLLNANFLEVASDIREAAELLVTILRGDDAKRENRRRFVREFVRPWGIDRSASRITVRAIEAVARRRTAGQLQSILAADRDTMEAALGDAPIGGQHANRPEAFVETPCGAADFRATKGWQ